MHLLPSSSKKGIHPAVERLPVILQWSELNFSMSSDAVCRARYLDSIEMSLLGEGDLDFRAIESAAASRWIAIHHTEGDGMGLQVVPQGRVAFFEGKEEDLPTSEGRGSSFVPCTTECLGRVMAER
jgi:hypothetical protein